MVQMVKISESEVAKVVDKYFNNETSIKIIDYTLTPASEDINGFMGEHLFLKINIENGSKTELRFFVKTLSTGKDLITEFIRVANMFSKEVCCYKFLEDVKTEYPTFDLSFAPKYYFSREDEIIVLEDVTKLGYKMWDGPLELDLEHIKLSLKALAKFHAASFIFEEVKSKQLGRKYQLSEDYEEGLQENLYRDDEEFLGFQYMHTGMKGLFTLKELMPQTAISTEEFKAKVSALQRQVFEDLKPSKHFRNVWCHGDLWTKNVMFRYKDGIPTDCMLFDFQQQRYNPPAHDVLFMIYQTADRETRQQYYDYLVDYYYDMLKVELEKYGYNAENIFSRDEYYNSMKALFPTIKVMKAIYKTLTCLSQETLKYITSDAKLYSKVNFSDRTEFIVKEYSSYKPYRDTMITLCGDLEDILAHSIITIEDCYTILNRKLESSQYDLLDYKIIPLEKSSTVGQIILQIKIRQTCNKYSDFTFFVKNCQKITQKNANKFNRRSFKEVKFYSKIVPKIITEVPYIKECVPRCLLARLNDVLVVEDLIQQNYATINASPFLGVEIVAVIIKKLAKLHSSALMLEERLSSPGNKYRLIHKYKEEFCETNYVQDNFNIQKFASLTLFVANLLTDFDNTASDSFKNKVAEMFHLMCDSVRPSQKYRNTFCHGCLCLDNILLKFKNNAPNDCLFLNFERYRYTPPAHDVMSFLCLNTNRNFRIQHITEILNVYYTELSTLFKSRNLDVTKILPYKQFLESCEDMKKFSVLQSVIHYLSIITNFNLDTPNDFMINTNAIEEVKSRIVDMCNQNAYYKEKLQECVLDLKDIIM